MQQFTVAFESADKHYPEVELDQGVCLSEALTIENSPILFGCRTGICGTCVIEVLEHDGLAPRSEVEQELLEIIAPDQPKARLACQIHLETNLRIRRL